MSCLSVLSVKIDASSKTQEMISDSIIIFLTHSEEICIPNHSPLAGNFLYKSY